MSEAKSGSVSQLMVAPCLMLGHPWHWTRRRSGSLRTSSCSITHPQIFRLHPTSALSPRNLQASSSSSGSGSSGGSGRGSAPKFILFEELQYTASLYGRCVSEVQLEWLSAAKGKGEGRSAG